MYSEETALSTCPMPSRSLKRAVSKCTKGKPSTAADRIDVVDRWPWTAENLPVQDVQPVGRESELDVIDEFLVRGRPSRTLLLVGDPGIGKTTLWEAGAALARERSRAVLVTRASG